MTANDNILAPQPFADAVALDMRHVHTELIDTLRASLATCADAENADPMQRYMKSAMPFFGVKTPQRRKVVTTVLNGAAAALGRNIPWLGDSTQAAGDGFLCWVHTSLALWRNARYREERYAVLDMARSRYARMFHTPEALPIYEEFIVTGAWWDFTDEVTHRITDMLEAAPQAMQPILRQWAGCDNVWKRRVAILSQLQRKERTDIALLEDCLALNMRSDTPEHAVMSNEFFIRKAIGWALRDYARTSPQYVLEYVETHRDALAALTIREATKHLK